MEELINKRVKEIQISGIRKFYNMTLKYPDVISLTLGQPDFNTPEHVKEAGIKAINANKTKYTENPGLLELRKEISKYIKLKYGMDYDPYNEIIVTNGASEGIDSTLRTILDEGSEVILPGPVYPGYEPIIKMCGAVPKYIDTRKNNFKITAEDIGKNITSKTRCIILPYPSNPTGAVLTKDEVQKIADVLRDREIFVLSDEIYSELVYDRNHFSIASIPGMKEKTIVINGLSKSHSMTGWRIGFILGPSYLTKHIVKVHQYNATCASSISQYAALEAVKNGSDDPLAMKNEYKKRRDYIFNRLINMGFEVAKPDGAFYIFPSISKFNMNSFEFASKLLEKQRVAVVPGDAFSSYGEGYIRLSFACSMDTLNEALNRIERFINIDSINL
ncbi:MAG TPA: aminotransferase A [Clostridiaceae bacterium]|jgi:aminotransferase|nr:aminotransferase A [Clostridiaceae bacterium]HBG38611.1 aminotransferase A [Clostridiaceae bacterium]